MDIRHGLRVAVIGGVTSVVMNVGLSHGVHQARLWRAILSINSCKKGSVDKYVLDDYLEDEHRL